MPTKQRIPISPSPRQPAAYTLLSVSMDLSILAIDSSNYVESLEGKIDDDGMSLLDKLSSNENAEEKFHSSYLYHIVYACFSLCLYQERRKD